MKIPVLKMADLEALSPKQIRSLINKNGLRDATLLKPRMIAVLAKPGRPSSAPKPLYSIPYFVVKGGKIVSLKKPPTIHFKDTSE